MYASFIQSSLHLVLAYNIEREEHDLRKNGEKVEFSKSNKGHFMKDSHRRKVQTHVEEKSSVPYLLKIKFYIKSNTMCFVQVHMYTE